MSKMLSDRCVHDVGSKEELANQQLVHKANTISELRHLVQRTHHSNRGVAEAHGLVHAAKSARPQLPQRAVGPLADLQLCGRKAREARRCP